MIVFYVRPTACFCPNCKKCKTPRHESKAEAFADVTATKAEREQWITGLCSDECWNAWLGIGRRA